MFYLIWPEGQPQFVFKTESRWKAFSYLYWQRFKMLFRLSKARRMRLAVCEEGYSFAEGVEYLLFKNNAVAPPGGWTIVNPPVPPTEHLSDKTAVVSVWTYPVI